LIGGESGTGKELAARMLHSLSSRKEEPFVAVHCAALSETLMESELFGHEKGAFTGADKRKPGRFDLAGSGTLFFDEVGEMSLSTQVKLLRVLQEREFMRVGGTRPIRTNARIVAATARDLRQEVKEERFRDDLYYRMSVVPVTVPPLRERSGDIPLLINHFLDIFGRGLSAQVKRVHPTAMQLLCNYAWPGNIRELRNIVERMLVLNRDADEVLPQFLPAEFHDGRVSPPATLDAGATLQDAVDTYEKQLIEQALAETNGVQTRAADKLGTTRRILRYRMEKLQIDVEGLKATDE
jgi:transcriptional regulator with GAF, ATPase, and Fis domain